MTPGDGSRWRLSGLRYLAVATWMTLALGVMAATLLHVASGGPLDLSTAFDWIASIAQVGAFLIVAVHWHEQLVLIENVSRRIEATEQDHRELLDLLVQSFGDGVQRAE